MFFDYHLHTWYSDDSDYKMEDLVRDTAVLGLDEICFTDHVDYGIKRDWKNPGCSYSGSEKAGLPPMNVKYPAYHEKIKKLQREYEDRMVIREGMEFGMQAHTVPLFEKLFSSYPFDFIILSCHQVDDLEFWNQDFQRGKTREAFRRSYYEEILKVVGSYKNYSVLGHLDLISRYDEGGSYPFERERDIIAQILKTAISDGKGLEVNTSSFRYGLQDLTPSVDILKLYRDLGGEILTIGSDTHAPSHLGAQIRETMPVLKDLGFKRLCTFDAMRPVFHKI